MRLNSKQGKAYAIARSGTLGSQIRRDRKRELCLINHSRLLLICVFRPVNKVW